MKLKQAYRWWAKPLAKIIPADVYSRNKFGGTNRMLKLSEEEIQDLFDFVERVEKKTEQITYQRLLREFERIQEDLDKEYGKGKYMPHFVGIIHTKIEEFKL